MSSGLGQVFVRHKINIWVAMIAGITIIGALLGWVQPARTAAMWSEPLLFSAEDGMTPFVLADSNGGVHVFWGSTGFGEQIGAIFYKQLLDDEWSETVDILASANGNAAVYPNAMIDSLGFIHLVWVSGQLFYSRAHISEALHPSGWSIPYQMTNYAVVNGVIQLGSDGSLNVLFSSQGTNPAVYLLKSEDGGDIWRVAIKVSEPQGGHKSHTCSLVIDGQARLHAAWGEAVQALAGEEDALVATLSGVYYAHSDDGGLHWSYPQNMAIGRYGEPVLGLDNNGNIHLLWAGFGEEMGNYHRWLDQGIGRWSDAVRIFSGSQGLLGPSGLAVDSAGHLHAAFPVEKQSALPMVPSSGIVAATWHNGQWEEIFDVTEGINGAESENGQPNLIVAGGNQLHLVWVATNFRSNLEGEYPTYIWYSTRQVDAPQSQLFGVPTLTTPLVVATLPAQAQAVLPSPTPWEVMARGILPMDAIWYKEVPVIFGGVLAGAVCLIILCCRVRKKDHVR